MTKQLMILFLIALTLMGCEHYSLAQGDPQPLPDFEPPSNPPKIALVLGGGGCKGLAHVGVLRELEQAGIHPDLIVGCSSGALIGALYADMPDVDRLEKLLLGLKKTDLIDFSFFYSRFGFVKGNSLEKFLQENLHVKTFEELKVPLVVIATDLHSGDPVELGGGPLIPALRGSAAVPGVFKPVPYLGRHLVDGGTVDPVPVTIAKKYGAQVIIAVDVGEKLSEEKIVHFFGIVRRGLNISYRELSKQAAREADILLQMDFEDLGMFNDERNFEIYQRGRIKARELLPKIQKVIRQKLVPKAKRQSPEWLLVQ